MTARLPTHLLVSALIRRAGDAGGSAMVLARGDADAGAVLIRIAERGVPGPVLERGIGPTGTTELLHVGPPAAESQAVDQWLERRRQQDPDVWIIELDVAGGERFAAETILAD